MALGVEVLAGLAGWVDGQRLGSLGQHALPHMLVAGESRVQGLSHRVAYQAAHSGVRPQILGYVAEGQCKAHSVSDAICMQPVVPKAPTLPVHWVQMRERPASMGQVSACSKALASSPGG